MQLELHTWKITGISPLLQNNPCEMWAAPVEEKEMKTGGRGRKPMYPGDTEAFKVAKRSLYVNDDGDLYHPAASFMNSLFDACAKRYFGKAAALGIIVMAVRIVEEEFLLYDPNTLDAKKPKKLTTEWVVDKRRGWNHNSDVGIVCIRPKWREWGGFVTLAIETEVTADIKDKETKEWNFPQALTELLNVSGTLFGVGVGRYKQNGTRGKMLGDKWGGMGTGRFKAELKH